MALIATHAIQVDFTAVAGTMGNICTPRAIQERLKKLKKTGMETAGSMLTPAAAKPKKGGKPAKTPTKKKSGPRGKANVQSEEDADEAAHGTQAEDSEDTTELMFDMQFEQEIAADMPPVEAGKAEVKTEEDSNDGAPAIQTGNGKAQKKTVGGKRPAKGPKAKQDNEKTLDDVTEAGKATAKPERKATKASGAAKAGKSEVKSDLSPDNDTSAITAEPGMKRKREDADDE